METALPSAEHWDRRTGRFLTGWSIRRVGMIAILMVAFPGSVPACLVAQSDVANDNSERRVSDLSLKPEGTRYLMLHNGGILCGTIQKVEDRWKVQIDDRTSVMIDNFRVSVIADCLEDIYTYRSQRISQFDVQQRVSLIQWCLKNELVQQASKEFESLSSLRLDENIRKQLAFQLKQAVDPTPIPSIAATLEATRKANQNRPLPSQAPIQMVNPPSLNAGGPIGPALLRSAQTDLSQETQAAQRNQELPSGDGEIHSIASQLPRIQRPDLPAPATAEQLTASVPPVSSVFKIYDIPGARQTPQVQQALQNQLSAASIQSFQDSLHGVVTESCAGCHFEGNAKLEGKTQFQLRLVSSKDPEDAIRYNLQQVLGLINRENPGNSELIKIASQPHGGLKEPPIQSDAAKQEALVQWVYSTQRTTTVPDDPAKVMLAGAQMEVSDAPDEASSLQPLPDRLTPQTNPSNPYDPSVFNQMGQGTLPGGSGLPPSSQQRVDSPTGGSGIPGNGSLFQHQSPSSGRTPPILDPRSVK